MNWRKRIKDRNKVIVVTIYRKPKHYPPYRVCWHANGRRMMKGHPTYSEAKHHADDLVKELANGSQIPSLTAGQASDALAAFDHLQRFYQFTGRRVSLLRAVSEFCEAQGRLPNHTVAQAIDGFLTTVAVVKRKALADAVAEFIAHRKPLAVSRNGERRRRSPATPSAT